MGGTALLGRSASGFKNATARRCYFAAYEELLAWSPPAADVHDVPTKFGVVRVYRHGPINGVPVVLIHGFFLTSAMWANQVAGLTSDFTIYLVDMPGQPGASVQARAMFTPADCAQCIDDVLARLGLEDVHLVGHSYGGWVATHTAARFPHRLATLTLVDPASTLAWPSARFWAAFTIANAHPRSATAQRTAAWMTGSPEPGSYVDKLARLFLAGFAAFAPPIRTPAPLIVSRRVLRAIHVPVQVLLAGNTVHDPTKALQRILAVVPGWQHQLWPCASHALPAEVADEVNASIRKFVNDHRAV
ncbi:alpha/beta hydrolase [Mycobacterium sp. CBMA293]|nr:alpha/beta hydrolase [Mycolicibacterium sp. CBMA 361]MUL47562.1 alpha/beta hydrolase [Mycolicibacterium sp. CBMA 360]MUL59552.1 alpha/beta hydrolase [Mycolicibacterium sp. CBMA 335]MUL71277.1 alpha/beta hydrolase [Mycolicibacterium sp. CBMA 311]MUL94920.1 alpha/beta hydrolase [Mycolicibacterium sp. CBMA 230]MUM03759.1 alpha/beta hydrolase [Mycolicibacterium sp. CBMA 213]MUM12040.1 alpha/beta hydrolase [Mycolicibacterium sp. CBMA 293]